MSTYRDDQRGTVSVGVFYDAPSLMHEDHSAFACLENLIGEYNPKTGFEIGKNVKPFNNMERAMRKVNIEKQSALYVPYSDCGLFGNFIEGDF